MCIRDRSPWSEVVGVVQDVKHELNLPITTDFYFPYSQVPWNSMVLVARTKVDPAVMTGPIKEQVWAVDKDQPVFGVHTMREVKAISVSLYSCLLYTSDAAD